MTAPPNIFIRHAYMAYDHVVIFQNLDLTLQSGKWSCLLGPSGVGKSSLLRMIANLTTENTQTSGEISCDNHLPLSQQIAYMAQTDLLLPWLSALDNTLISAKLNNCITPSLINHAKNLLAEVGLQDAMQKLPRELSGGMRQRVALVRTILQDKPIILMDEPFSALDTVTRFQLQNWAAKLLKNKTVFLVTHDPIEALRLADEIYILSGQPATLNLHVELNSASPRDPSDPALITQQATLFHALLQAKEISA